jgi:hypothetical protein
LALRKSTMLSVASSPRIGAPIVDATICRSAVGESAAASSQNQAPSG